MKATGYGIAAAGFAIAAALTKDGALEGLFSMWSFFLLLGLIFTRASTGGGNG